MLKRSAGREGRGGGVCDERVWRLLSVLCVCVHMD